jgi:hypothetical protein
MRFELLVFLLRGFSANLCPTNWLYEASSGECKQTNIALICTGNSLVVVAKVDDLYLILPENDESDTRLQIGSCTGKMGPLERRYIGQYTLDECEPEVTAREDGIKLTWEVTGTSVSSFDDVFKYSASCEIWTDGSEFKEVAGDFELVTVQQDSIAEIVAAQSQKVKNDLFDFKSVFKDFRHCHSTIIRRLRTNNPNHELAARQNRLCPIDGNQLARKR